MVGRVGLVPVPLPWSGVLCWVLIRSYCWVCCAGAGLAAMVGSAVLVLGPPPWPGVQYWCWAPLHGQLCCASVRPVRISISKIGFAAAGPGPLPHAQASVSHTTVVFGCVFRWALSAYAVPCVRLHVSAGVYWYGMYWYGRQ